MVNKNKWAQINSFLCGTLIGNIVSLIPAFAFTISPNVKPSDFNTFTGENISGLLLGTVFWILRVFGVLLVMYSIYGIVTAKKDGDANNIGVSMTKLVFGIVFITLPQVFRALGIITIPA